MKTNLLRAARRDRNGGRSWVCPGMPHAFRAFPSTAWPGTTQLSWPDTDSDGEVIRRGCRFDWHGRVAFRRIRHILEQVNP
jgi:hypothetical protein